MSPEEKLLALYKKIYGDFDPMAHCADRINNRIFYIGDNLRKMIKYFENEKEEESII
jgi:hypothetical protein